MTGMRFVDKNAPGTIWAAVALSSMAAAFAVVGVAGTTIDAALSGALSRGEIWTNSLVPSTVLDRRPPGFALVLGGMTAIVVCIVLVLAAVRLGRRRQSGLVMLTLVCCLLVVGDLTLGLMIGTGPVVQCAVATGCAWAPASRRFLRGSTSGDASDEESDSGAEMGG